MATDLRLLSCMLVLVVLGGCAGNQRLSVDETLHPAVGISGWPDVAGTPLSTTQLAATGTASQSGVLAAGSLAGLSANGALNNINGINMNGTVPPIQPSPPGSVSMSAFNVSLNVTVNR